MVLFLLVKTPVSLEVKNCYFSNVEKYRIYHKRPESKKIHKSEKKTKPHFTRSENHIFSKAFTPPFFGWKMRTLFVKLENLNNVLIISVNKSVFYSLIKEQEKS